jgi:hypothetical protein
MPPVATATSAASWHDFSSLAGQILPGRALRTGVVCSPSVNHLAATGCGLDLIGPAGPRLWASAVAPAQDKQVALSPRRLSSSGYRLATKLARYATRGDLLWLR